MEARGYRSPRMMGGTALAEELRVCYTMLVSYMELAGENGVRLAGHLARRASELADACLKYGCARKVALDVRGLLDAIDTVSEEPPELTSGPEPIGQILDRTLFDAIGVTAKVLVNTRFPKPARYPVASNPNMQGASSE